MGDTLLTVGDVQERLRCSRGYAYDLIASSPGRVKIGRAVRLRPEALEAAVAAMSDPKVLSPQWQPPPVEDPAPLEGARLYRRSKFWWCWGYYRDGGRWQRSTRQTDRSEALKAADKIARELCDRFSPPRRPRVATQGRRGRPRAVDRVDEDALADALRNWRVDVEPAPDPGGTYLVEAAGTPLLKIGRTRHLRKRLASLRAMSPVALFLVAAFSSEEAEAFLHAAFDRSRSHGEWFLTEPVLSALHAWGVYD